MAHETPTITAQTRERTGTRFSQRLRKAGRLPAVIYGHKSDPVSISLDEKEILLHLHHGSHVVNVTIEGGKTETCLVKELQFGYLGDNIIHLDLARVDLDEEVHVQVHLNFIGKSTEAQKVGAIVSHPITELEVICKVSAIPGEIKVDSSKMEGTIFTVGDIELPPGVRTEIKPDTPVLTISFIHEEEAVGEEVEVADETTSEPEVITETKPEETKEGKA